jgi:hypothetical protein
MRPEYGAFPFVYQAKRYNLVTAFVFLIKKAEIR